jgi:hypothetical protein
MDRVSPLPSNGAVFFDPRDEGRSLRVSFHQDLGVFVLSQWRGAECLATFRLATTDVPQFIYSMTRSLSDASGVSELDQAG